MIADDFFIICSRSRFNSFILCNLFDFIIRVFCEHEVILLLCGFSPTEYTDADACNIATILGSVRQ